MKSLEFNKSFDEANDNQFDQLVRDIFLPWNTFDYEKKCTKFSEHTCHELNYFLFKKDRAFFDGVVKQLLMNKLEK